MYTSKFFRFNFFSLQTFEVTVLNWFECDCSNTVKINKQGSIQLLWDRFWTCIQVIMSSVLNLHPVSLWDQFRTCIPFHYEISFELESSFIMRSVLNLNPVSLWDQHWTSNWSHDNWILNTDLLINWMRNSRLKFSANSQQTKGPCSKNRILLYRLSSE